MANVDKASIDKAVDELSKTIKRGNSANKIVATNDVSDIENTGVTNTTGLGSGEYFQFFTKSEYEDWKNNGLLQKAITVTNRNGERREYTRLYVAVNSYRKSASGDIVAKQVKFTDAGNLSKTEFLSSVEPDEKGAVVDAAAARQTIPGGLNEEIASCYTPYEKVLFLAGSTICGKLSNEAHLQQKFDGRQPVANTYIWRKITLPEMAE